MKLPGQIIGTEVRIRVFRFERFCLPVREHVPSVRYITGIIVALRDPIWKSKSFHGRKYSVKGGNQRSTDRPSRNITRTFRFIRFTNTVNDCWVLTRDRQNSAKNRIPEISGKPIIFPRAPLFSSLVLLVGRDLLFRCHWGRLSLGDFSLRF